MASREHVLHLLAEAAELEHNLLCSYLYAAFSLKRSVDEDLTPHELEAVERWRRTLMSVCVEEMAHLAQVANLTVALGGRPHFNRPNLPVGPGYHPAGVAVSLTPFDEATLAHFIFLERSDEVRLDDAAPFANDEEIERPETPDRLTPSAPHYETIGEFYAVLRQRLQALCDRLTPARVFVGAGAQLDAKESGVASLRTVHDLSGALEAIEMIVAQGEGSAEAGEESHFARFSAMAEELAALRAARPAFEPARRVARNPVMRPPHDDDRVHVTAPAARQVLDLANAAYWLMLRVLSQLYETPRAETALRGALVGTMFGCMHLLADTAGALTRLSATDDAAGPCAGPTFTMMRSTEGIAAGVAPAPLLLERIDDMAAAIDAAALEPSLRDRLHGRVAAMRQGLEPLA